VRVGAALLGLLLVAGACGNPTGTFVISLSRNGTQVSAVLVDEVGLVTAASAGAVGMPEPGPAQAFVWNPNGDLTRIGISWPSDTCSDRPQLHLTGNALLLTIDEGSPTAGCPTTQVTNLITLSINRVVDTSSITVRLLPR
jgi:hypothetical protein